MNSWRRLILVLFAGVGCIVLLGLLLLYANYASSAAVPTFPRVTITTTFPQGLGEVHHAVVVFGEAIDPDGIGIAELWVNGNRVSSQANTDQSPSSFEISQSWIPDGPGNYLFVLRGIDRKGFAAESSPVMIHVAERANQPELAPEGQYIVQEGDTLGSIAEHFGTTPEEIRRLNPDLGDPVPGTSMRVPPRPETPASAGAEPPAAGASAELPHVAPPPAPSPAGGSPAEPASPPWWGFLPLPGHFGCIFSPAMCASPIGDEGPLSPASDVHASLVDDCHASVSWTDNSTSEAGFRVYRLVMRPRFRSDLLALLAPAPGSGSRLTYADTTVPTGQFFYALVTVNARGEEVWGVPSEEITSTCLSAPASAVSTIDVEALEMTVRESSIDRLYCYVSLAASPFERIPQGASDFITLEGGTWNIAEYASGDNKRTLILDSTRPLEIIAACLGRQGDTLIDLGRFTRSHPPEEWDGRMLTAGPESGAFSVTYRIQPTPPEGSGGRGGGFDPSIPAPFNLRATDSWTSCTRAVDGRILCGPASGPGLAWDYNVDPSAPRPPLYYKLYRRADASSPTRLSYTTLDNHMSAPRDDCGSYSVSVVVGPDPISGAEVESPPSELLDSTCAELEITLEWLQVHQIHDGDPGTGDYEAWGALGFMSDDNLLLWGRTLSLGDDRYTVIDQNVTYYWADMLLGVYGADLAQYTNVLRVPIQDGQALSWRFVFIDDDEVTSPESFCATADLGGRYVELMPARSSAEWRAVDEGVVYARRGPGDCTLAIHVRGIPAGTP